MFFRRYPETEVSHKTKDQFRNYKEPPRETVREFYRLNHTRQTFAFVLEKKKRISWLSTKEEDECVENF